MSKYDLEIGDNCESSICHCCGQESCTGHGFLYKDDDAHAVYYVAWSNTHAKRKVSFAIAVGEWDDESTSDDHTCFGLEAYESEERILFRIIEPVESPWADTDLLGKMLSRKESLVHPLLKEVFVIAEHIVRNHTAVREYLSIPV